MFSRRSTLAFAAALSFAASARAELGRAVSAMPAERGIVAAQISAVDKGSYTRHDLTRANGGLVHEFVNGGGQVFAVTWSGPGKPDLRTLLGSYFTMITGSASAAPTTASLRQPMTVNQPDLQIQTAGHMGWFHGVAFLPSLAPVGFDPADLKVTS